MQQGSSEQKSPIPITRPSFINTIFSPEDLVEIRKINPAWTKPKLEWHKSRDLKKAYASLAKENEFGTGIYFGVNPRKEKGSRDSSGIINPRVLCADIDFHESESPDLNAFNDFFQKSGLPKATAITNSGHGFQLFWKIFSMTTAEWEEAQRFVISAFNGKHNVKGPADRTIKDLPRVMRLPGFKNWRNPDRPVMAKVLLISPEVIYPISRFLPSASLSSIDRAKRYLDSTPGAVSGQGGDNHTFTVACRLVNDFSLSPEEGWPLLLEWNRKCSPPWSEEDLRKKLSNAVKYHTAAPGKLLSEKPNLQARATQPDSPQPSPSVLPEKPPTFQEKTPGQKNYSSRCDMAELTELMQKSYLICGKTVIWHDGLGMLMQPDAFRLLFNQEGKEWLKSYDKKILPEEKLVFDPAGAKEDEVNMFRGYRITPKPGPIDLIKKHILSLCGNDESLADWVTSWMAYPLQHPGAKLQTALIFHGTFGTGKNILFDSYLKLYEPYAITLNQQILDGKFTDWLSRKCFILADEVIASTHQGIIKNRLKQIITSRNITIEAKGLPCRRESNHANFVFLSNNDMPLLVDNQDRRYAIIKSDIVHEEDYYVALARQLEGPEALRSFLHYLLDYDCGTFYEHSKPPMTAAKEALIELCAPSHQRFISKWKRGEIPGFEFKSISGRHLYVVYKIWCEASGEKQYIATETKFGTEASKDMEKYKAHIGLVYKGAIPGIVGQDEVDAYRKMILSEKM